MLKRQLLIAAGLGLAAATGQVHAQVSVTEPWVRATVPQQKATGFFAQLRAPRGARLVAATSPLAATVEVHEMRMQGDNVMRMRPVAALPLPAGERVELKPGGYHVMLMDLKQQAKPGERVAVTLVFEDTASGKRESVEVQAPVRALGAAAAGAAKPVGSQ